MVKKLFEKTAIELFNGKLGTPMDIIVKNDLKNWAASIAMEIKRIVEEDRSFDEESAQKICKEFGVNSFIELDGLAKFLIEKFELEKLGFNVRRNSNE